jgi:glycosyltransferase involved in cell wall biosynthesis
LFLGFIERKEQLLLMKSSISVIQPSLFEGWSTVVEDAKAMSKHIILSSLEVHREQLNENVIFFKPDNEKELAEIISESVENMPVEKKIDYTRNRINFAEKFIFIINNLKD